MQLELPVQRPNMRPIGHGVQVKADSGSGLAPVSTVTQGDNIFTVTRDVRNVITSSALTKKIIITVQCKPLARWILHTLHVSKRNGADRNGRVTRDAQITKHPCQRERHQSDRAAGCDGLLAIVMAAVTSILISNMMAQQKIDAQFRSQLDVRQALYDMEKNLSEAKRKDAGNNQPIFQEDMVSSFSERRQLDYVHIYESPRGKQSYPHGRITDARPIRRLSWSQQTTR